MNKDEAGAGAIHGWGCTPTGDPPPATIPMQENVKSNCFSILFHRGWRRNALFGILVFLSILVFCNIALTLWIITCLRLNMGGIGPLKIINGGLQLADEVWIVDRLIASTITSQIARPITLHAHRNFTVLVTEPNTNQRTSLVIKRNGVVCNGATFEIQNNQGETVFRASRDEVRVSADLFTVDSIGGLVSKHALQTPLVKAPPGSDLQLESSTRRLDLRAPQSISLESRAGNIDVTSYNNIKLHSVVGAINVDASNLIINNLMEANLTNKLQKGVRNRKVYQLCACASGRLFLAAPDAICEALDNHEPCR